MGQEKNVSADQIRAARAILGLSQGEVAALTGKTTKTLRRAETDLSTVSKRTVNAIRSALEAAGVEFIAENGGGAGVRLRK